MKYNNVKIDPDFIKGLFIFKGFKYNPEFEEYCFFKNESEPGLEKFGLCVDFEASFLDSIKIYIKPSQSTKSPNFFLLDSSKTYNINIDNYFIEFTPVECEDNKIIIPICLRSFYKYVFEYYIRSSLKILEDLCAEDNKYTLTISDTYNLRASLRTHNSLPSNLGVIKYIELYGNHVNITWANVDRHSDGGFVLITSAVTFLEYKNIDYSYIEEKEDSCFLNIVVFK